MADGSPPPGQIQIPGKIVQAFFTPQGLWRPSRFKGMRGGRGSAKSETFARLGVAEARIKRPIEEGDVFLCVRQFQNSIRDSVHKQLNDAIWHMGLAHEFDIQRDVIRHTGAKKNAASGVSFIFRGLARSIGEIKSMKGIRVAWLEEAQSATKESWDVLIPTVRAEGEENRPGAFSSELWASFNPENDADPTYQLLVKSDPAALDAIVVEVNWRDNPWFPRVLEKERLRCLALDPEAYDWIWEGKLRKISNATIFAKRVNFEGFDEIPVELLVQRGSRPRYGMDFGFADDPSVLVRCYELEGTADDGARWKDLYVTHAEFGYHVEYDDLPALMDKVPGSREWPIKADSALPGLISKLSGSGFNISGAEKWPHSVEDGIIHMKGYRTIYVQSGLDACAQEFRLYAYKTDPRQLDQNGQPMVLPIVLDRWNHSTDSLRYALDGEIQRGGLGVWGRL